MMQRNSSAKDATQWSQPRLDRSKHPAIPSGPTEIRDPYGSLWDFKFVKVEANVAQVK
jgi:hypothetical protein